MKNNNETFFKEKKCWSEVKDSLLGTYLIPYINKNSIYRSSYMLC